MLRSLEKSSLRLYASPEQKNECGGRHLLVLTRYGRLGASSRQRILLFKEPLQRLGVTIVENPLLSDAYLRRLYDNKPMRWLELLGRYVGRAFALLRSPRSSVVWLEKEALPWM